MRWQVPMRREVTASGAMANGVTAGRSSSGDATVSARHWERGAGTVLAVAAIGVLLVLTAAGLQLGAAATAAHRARSAADLAALAGATALQEGQGDACARAADVARRNDGQVLECSLGVGESIVVRVSLPVALQWPGVPERAVASARAGPAGNTLAGQGANAGGDADQP